MTLTHTLSASELQQKIDALIAEKHLLKHPFYTAWTEGRLTQTHLARYAEQYFHHVLAEPTYLSAVHFNTPHFGTDISIRQEILANLVGEELGENNHPKLWKDFSLAVGCTQSELANSEMLDTTRHLVNTFRSVCLSAPFYAGLAALYAYESQIPAIAAAKVDGLKKNYGMTEPQDYAFFTVHEQADIHHSKAEMDIITRTADTVSKQETVLTAVETATDALWLFLDGVYDAYCQEVIAARAELSLN